jgi:AcrR family transcriptional regulator
MSDPEPGAAAPGTIRQGGRTARITRAVHQAVAELAAERGRAGVTIPAVAARSGVHEATIYRRWKDADALLIDVGIDRLEAEVAVPDTGDLRTDLRQWAGLVAGFLGRADGPVFFGAVVAAAAQSGQAETGWHRQRAARYIAGHGSQLQAALDRARDRGQAPPARATVLDKVLAPLCLRAALGYRPAGDDLDALIDTALRD